MTKSIKGLLAMIAGCYMLLGSGAVVASLINYTISGTVIVPGLGLSAGNIVTATGTFDDSPLDGLGDGNILFNSGSGNTMTIDLNGLYTLTESNDQRYSISDGAKFTFSGGGTLASFDYLSTAGVNGATTDFGSLFLQFDENDFLGSLIGSWDTFNYTVVPVPAAVWLFGSGLLGLASVARRKRNRT